MSEFRIGSDVLIGNDIRARIRAIEIRGPEQLVTYQCAWWDERTLKSEWVYSDEITPLTKKKTMRGFHSGAASTSEGGGE